MKEIDQREFVQTVIEGSRRRPVVVDFWSVHCPPCHVLGPVLESLEAVAEGAWELVKIDVDDNPQLADDYRVMSIPAVKAFVDGEVVDAFVGAWPRERIQAWLADVVPSPADRQLREGRRAEEAGEVEAARLAYAAVIGADPQRYEAHLGLARLALRQADIAAAAEHLARVPEAEWAALGGQPEAIWLQTTVARMSPPTDALDRQYQRGMRLAAEGEFDEGLRELLAVVVADVDWRGGLAGSAMVRVIAALGERDPRAGMWRSRLGRALYR